MFNWLVNGLEILFLAPIGLGIGYLLVSERVDFDKDGLPFAYDCNDFNAAVRFGAPEICDGVDNDCDGVTDQIIWPKSTDGDVFGDIEIAETVCLPPPENPEAPRSAANENTNPNGQADTGGYDQCADPAAAPYSEEH
jgi:hypothetical protein